MEKEDKIEGMTYKHKDPETGKEIIYGVSYSQKLLQKIDDDLKRSNTLKIILMILFIMIIAVGLLIWFNTGTVGQLARMAICP